MSNAEASHLDLYWKKQQHAQSNKPENPKEYGPAQHMTSPGNRRGKKDDVVVKIDAEFLKKFDKWERKLNANLYFLFAELENLLADRSRQVNLISSFTPRERFRPYTDHADGSVFRDHQDFHGDMTHSDSGGTNHSDTHADDFRFADAPHVDQVQHGDHTDQYSDNGHDDAIHTDQIVIDNPYADHADGAGHDDGIPHSDGDHTDTPHGDYSDTGHSDGGHDDSGHDDGGHDDAAHDDGGHGDDATQSYGAGAFSVDGHIQEIFQTIDDFNDRLRAAFS